MLYVYIAALLALGAVMVLMPHTLWRIEHYFSVKGGEPTELYLTFMRLGGVFFMGAAVVALAISLI